MLTVLSTSYIQKYENNGNCMQQPRNNRVNCGPANGAYNSINLSKHTVLKMQKKTNSQVSGYSER